MLQHFFQLSITEKQIPLHTNETQTHFVFRIYRCTQGLVSRFIICINAVIKIFRMHCTALKIFGICTTFKSLVASDIAHYNVSHF